MSINSNNYKLPPISSIDVFLPSGWKSPDLVSSTLPTPPQQEQQWKSPPYRHSVELNRDRSFNTLPIISPNASQKIENDINTVVQQCHTLSDNILLNKNEFIHHQINSNTALDDMINSANEVLNALLRLRKHQILSTSQDISTVEQFSHSSDANLNTEAIQAKPTVARQRKRGKRPPFQGKCHSCNISETPEWRRGPDGARTLCNACGLHYAKIARKQHGQKR